MAAKSAIPLFTILVRNEISSQDILLQYFIK